LHTNIVPSQKFCAFHFHHFAADLTGHFLYDGYVSYMMFNKMELGYANSLAWMSFMIVMVLIVILFTTSRRWVYFLDQE